MELYDSAGFTAEEQYRDNIYICLLHFLDGEVPFTKEIISLLLGATNGIKLKWEPTSDHVVWGEATLNTKPTTLSLTRKGVVRELGEPGTIPEWDSWTDVCSPHARPDHGGANSRPYYKSVYGTPSLLTTWSLTLAR